MPPTNTSPPFITALGDVEVGDTLAGSIGSWTGTGLTGEDGSGRKSPGL
jgi:hypothetical protein